MADTEKNSQKKNDFGELPKVTYVDTSMAMPFSATVPQSTPDQALWVAIRNRTTAIGFERYSNFVDKLLCEGGIGNLPASIMNVVNEVKTEIQTTIDRVDAGSNCPSIHGVYGYKVLKLATEVFLMLEAGVVGNKSGGFTLLDPRLFREGEEATRLNRQPITIEDIEKSLNGYFGKSKELPYLRAIIDTIIGSDTSKREEKLPYCEALLKHRFTCPSMIELIWSYWHEEGMLAQTMNTIALRFQNRKGSSRDPLVNFELDALRPLNNLLWGYIQDRSNRLEVVRRAYEYDHHYGITLHGKAIPALRSADSRSKFLASYHNLLSQCAVYYRADADLMVKADGFPLLNALRETHLILAEGAHNQFGDLPWTARVEMLIEQWLLHRPEIREFLRGRYMVPYKETWMGQVDAMKKLQGWTDTTVTHFHELAVYGEQLLLTIRYGNWGAVNDTESARNWALYWKPEVQGYMHAYKAATGVDLTTVPTGPVDAKPPWIHLQARLGEQQRRVKAG